MVILEMHFKEIKKPPIKRMWYQCPHCGKNLIVYDNTAHCSGIFVKCKNCKNEVEIRI